MRFNKALVFARRLLPRCFPAADKHGVWSVVNHRRRSMINTETRAWLTTRTESAINTVLGKKGKVF